jgi:hypothetical protein
VKKIVPIILSLAFLLQSSAYLLILAGYEVNKDYIAKNLCVNRAKPAMKCNGKCHMHKLMQAQEKRENKGVPGAKNIPQIVLFGFEKQAKLNNFSKTIIPAFTAYAFRITALHKAAVFHPPVA